VLWEVTLKTFDAWANSHFQPVRLIGMAARNLSRGEQMTLFTAPVDQKRLDRAVDKIVARFGDKVMRRGR
jgi:hypothetical protein